MTTPTSHRTPTGVRRRLATIHLPGATGLFLAAGALAAMSLGLPWGAAPDGSSPVISRSSWANTPTAADVLSPSAGVDPVRVDADGRKNVPQALFGAQHPVRVIGPVAALLLVSAVRRGRRGRARAAVAVGAPALLLGLDSGLTSGRAVYAAALVLAALGTVAARRPARSGRG